MKLKPLLEMDRKGLLKAQQQLIDGINDSDWSIKLTNSELTFTHPGMTGMSTSGRPSTWTCPARRRPRSKPELWSTTGTAA